MKKGLKKIIATACILTMTFTTQSINLLARDDSVGLENLQMDTVSQVYGSGSWQDISGHFYEGDKTGVPETPYKHDYTKTLTMKIFVADRDFNNTSKTAMKFDEVLELVKAVDEVTRGMPKIYYLVGWQYNGHDDGYPSWGKVNEALKCTNCNHQNSTECLRWLMDEGLKYNTTISLHINSTDAYRESPTWQEYIDNDLISKDSNGKLMSIGSWGNIVKQTAYQVNYKNEWEKGFYKKRVDELLALLPIERAGTIHSDAFFCRASKQSNLAQEQEARRKMFRYWRECGVDLTTEFLHTSNGTKTGEDNSGGEDGGLIGLVPMIWHFNQSMQQYMMRPASLITGGNINTGINYGNDQEAIGFLFGRSMHGEDDFMNPSNRWNGVNPNWEKAFIPKFCLQTVPWAYQNQFKRLKLEGVGNDRTVTYSDNLIARLKDKTLIKDGKKIREGNNIFIPCAWKDKEIIAYSELGYSNKMWELPNTWQDISVVDVFCVTKDGLITKSRRVNTSNKALTLTLKAGEMVIVVPEGTIILEPEVVPDSPQKVRGDRFNTNQVGIRWEGSKMSEGYKVLRKTSDEKEYTQIGETSSTQYIDSTANKVSGKHYRYAVKAFNSAGESLIAETSLIDQEKYLSDLPWKSVKVQSNDNWAQPKNDVNTDGKPIKMHGITYEKGLSMHANSEVNYELGGKYTKLLAVLGTDDYNRTCNKPTSIRCDIYKDGVLQYESNLITIHSEDEYIEIDVEDAQELKLVVHDNGNGQDSDWCNWGAIRLIPRDDDSFVENSTTTSGAYTLVQ